MKSISPQEPNGIQPIAEPRRVEDKPQGVYWKDDIYLVQTSDIDGKKRWETIILLLAGKLRNRNVDQRLKELLANKRKANEP